MGRSIIEVIGTQKQEGIEEDKIELITVGEFYKKKDAYYIIYKESQITGLEGVTTSVKVAHDCITLIRMGNANLKQEFREGIYHKSNYVTPHGTLFMGVKTNSLEYDLTERGGHISLKYNLFIDDQLVSYNGLRITIKEEAPNECLRND